MKTHFEVIKESKYWCIYKNGIKLGCCSTMQYAIEFAKSRAWREQWGTASVGWTNIDGSKGYCKYG